MKFKKKTAIIVSFALGTMMFASTALAEVASKSGYEQLKDAAKYTAESCSEKLPNYTIDMSFSIKDNGNVVMYDNEVMKYDLKNNATENISKRSSKTKKATEGYYYTDKNSRITYDNYSDSYIVTELTKAKEEKIFENPFKEKRANDLEKIADAFVGNLKDAVVVNQNADGSKTLSGSLTEAQIPAVVNAITSFQFKNASGGYSQNRGQDEEGSYMPKITKDIFVKDVKGNMDVNKDGLIQKVLFTGTLVGKDESGKEHSVTFELLGKMENINSTTVKKPDLSGKKVEKTVERDYSKLSNPERYTGKYKADIVREKDGKLEKIGEKIVDITKVDDKGMSGKYHEEYKKGYESYASNQKEFNFDGKVDKQSNGTHFSYTAPSGKDAQGYLDIRPYSTQIYFGTGERHQTGAFDNDTYTKVFE